MLEHAEFIHELLFPNGQSKSGPSCDVQKHHREREKEARGVRELLKTDQGALNSADHVALLGYN